MKTSHADAPAMTCRDTVLRFAAAQYGTVPESLWLRFPGYVVLRRADNQKWYALIMNLPREKLGLSGSGEVDVVELKCDPLLRGSLLESAGILPAYHMHKGSWITVLLDGTVPQETLCTLLDLSFVQAASQHKASKPAQGDPHAWIVPANPAYFDLEQAFTMHETIRWKQSSHICKGDLVYLYVTAPISAIRYQCRAVDVDIPYQQNTGKVHMHHVMELRLLHCFDPEQFSLDTLRHFGVSTIRGPRHVPHSLHCAILALCDQT